MERFPHRIGLLTLGLLLALVVPVFVRSQYVLHVLVLLGIWIILTDSLNFITGFAGQLALGHAAFVAIGGYTGALLMIDRGWTFWPALLIGGAMAFASGLVLGLMAMRLRGDYLGLVTLAFAEIIRLLAINLIDLTRGPMGLPGIPRPTILGYRFSGDVPYYYLVLALVAFTHVTIERLLFSRFGRACLAVRDDEQAAGAMGINTYHYKALAFCISSAYAGLAGVFYASWTTFFSPDSFTVVDSIMVAVMNTLGGIGALEGAIPGGIVIGALPELLRPFTTGPRLASLRMAGVGLVMIVFLLVLPRGILGNSTEKLYVSLEPTRRLLVRLYTFLRRRAPLKTELGE